MILNWMITYAPVPSRKGILSQVVWDEETNALFRFLLTDPVSEPSLAAFVVDAMFHIMNKHSEFWWLSPRMDNSAHIHLLVSWCLIKLVMYGSGWARDSAAGLSTIQRVIGISHPPASNCSGQMEGWLSGNLDALWRPHIPHSEHSKPTSVEASCTRTVFEAYYECLHSTCLYHDRWYQSSRLPAEAGAEARHYPSLREPMGDLFLTVAIRLRNR